jgi:hypothetical protein
MKTWLSILVVVLVAGAWAWPRSGSVVRAAQGNVPVQMVPAGQKQAGNPGEKGATYFGLEAQITKLTTKFHDGHVAVTERGLLGDVRTTLRDPDGNDRAQLRLNPIDGGRDSVRYEPSGGASFQTLSDPGAGRHTLDWATRQTYGLAKDGTDNLVWDGGTMRPRGARRRDVDADVSEVETVWANGLVGRLTRQTYSRRELGPGRSVQGPALVSELTLNGTPAGTGVWFINDQVYAYSFPGGLGGAYIGPEHVKQRYGGWGFTPDTTWVNLQTIALYHFKTQIKARGFVAKSCDAPRANRLAQFFFPTVQANEPGCDGLHWIDGTVLRACCDDHDRCYAQNGCDSSSWWRFWSGWSCTFCNMEVVGCFSNGGDPRCGIMRLAC